MQSVTPVPLGRRDGALVYTGCTLTETWQSPMIRFSVPVLAALLLLSGCAEEDRPADPFENGLFGENLGSDGVFGGTLEGDDVLGGGSFFDELFGGGGNGATEGETVAAVSVTTSAVTQTIDRSDRYDLTISGSDNVVTVGEDNDIRTLLVSGDRNTVTVGRGTAVETLEFTGFNNLVRVPQGSGIRVARDTGADNTLETY